LLGSRIAAPLKPPKHCLLSLPQFGPALGDHVVHIVLLGAEKEVIDVAATRRVASVQNPHPVWDWATMNFPRNAMSAFGPAATINVAVAAVIPSANK
jgi:hypothetical protein